MQQQYNVDAQFRNVFIFASAILLDHHFACMLCSRIWESTLMRSAACVCVCVFYKLELEPSGLIMWPGNYTGLSEEAIAAYVWHQRGSGLGLSEEKRYVQLSWMQLSSAPSWPLAHTYPNGSQLGFTRCLINTQHLLWNISPLLSVYFL